MKDETHENIDDEVYEFDIYKIDKMSLDETLWRKRGFEIILKYIWYKISNGMTCIH